MDSRLMPQFLALFVHSSASGVFHRPRSRFATVSALVMTGLMAVGVPGRVSGQDGPPAAVRGDEWVAWTQPTSADESAATLRYTAYVDAVAVGTIAASCSSSATPQQFECSAPLPVLTPGLHTLQLTAANQATGIESSRSSGLTLDVLTSANGATTVLSAKVGSGVNTAAARASIAPSRACAADSAACFRVDLLAEGLSDVAGLAPLADGRVLLIDHQNRVLLVAGGRVTVAYEASRTRDFARIVGLAVDSAFEASHFVYLAIVAEDAASTSTLSIVRLREVAGVLGETATVVADVPLGDGQSPVLSFGPDGNLYVAVAQNPSAGGGRSPYAGRVLRFTSLGASAGDARVSTPVLAEGAIQPSALAWQNARLWVADRAPSAGASLFVLAQTASSSNAWPRRLVPVSVASSPDLGQVAGLAVVGSAPASQRPASVYLLDGNRRALFLATVIEGDGVVRVEAARPIALGALAVVGVASDPTGAVFALVKPAADGSSSSVGLVRLIPE